MGESGARILDAHLSVRNAGNGEVIVANSKADGSFVVPDLLPGQYVVTASAAGYAASQATVTINGPGDVVANFVLHGGHRQGGSVESFKRAPASPLLQVSREIPSV